MTRNWTTVCDDLFDGSVKKESGRTLTRESVENAAKRMKWLTVPEDGHLTLAAMPGMAINAVITEFRIPKVTKVAVSHALAPYGLYGIEGNYSNGRARIFVIDTGSGVTPVFSDFYVKEAA